MAPGLPSSLSPHICILPSQDLTDLLESSSLPPLPHILQSFSPLPQVTTRTTSLVSVPHASFALRFSDLIETEIACKEDEEQRAVRTIDWMGARINKRCSKWVEDVEKSGDKEAIRTPWWDELRRCAEGEHVPSKSEGWNHPVAVILAVSTTAPNPLQAITSLHARAMEFPSWVDPNFLRYTLIIHPRNSPLSDEEAGALFNAVKKQFGLHSYFLALALPTPAPAPIPVPALMPRLPPLSSRTSLSSQPTSVTPGPNGLNTLRMAENDIQQTARFTREFVVMSLLPWMEKCVVEWNENFSSTRRLPSRLFSSTRRLFGSPSPSPSPAQAHQTSSSISSLPSRVANSASTTSPSSQTQSALSQQRRLAEFATILGDLKLATSVWEALRKEGNGGTDILPLLLSPSPTSRLYAHNTVSGMHTQIQEPPPHAQLRSLICAARWEAGITHSDFISDILEGERWLVWAAGNAEEPPSALLLAHAALLSSRKRCKRRAALWYLIAANRLEKCGIKPLTMYFLRRAHELYSNRPQKSLSPSFWESEGASPLDVRGIDAIVSGIEHPLGRLLYTTGDVAGAVRVFLDLLRGSSKFYSPLSNLPPAGGAIDGAVKIPGTDKVFLDDFRVAFAHFKSTSGDDKELMDLKLPFSFCLERQTRIRLPGNSEGTHSVWEKREEDWKTFWRSRGGKSDLSKSGTASVDEIFWVDLVLRNPLDAEVNLSNVTVIVQDSNRRDSPSSCPFVEVEVIDDIVLTAKELRTVPICIKSKRPASLFITHVTYEFLSLLPSREFLASRGRRLHDTPSQRQKATYAPDVLIQVEVKEANYKLFVSFVDDEHLVLVQGERKVMKLWFSNTGVRPIKDVWIIAGEEDELLIDVDVNDLYNPIDTSQSFEIISSNNSLTVKGPCRVPLTTNESPFNPGDSVQLPALLHAGSIGDQELSLLFVYRESETDSFQSTRLTQYYEVHPLLETSVTARPCHTLDYSFSVNLEISNVSLSDPVHLTQITSLSPYWKCHPIEETQLGSLPPSQVSRFIVGAKSWDAGSGSEATLDFVSRKLNDVLQGNTIETTNPPPIDLLCSHILKTSHIQSVEVAGIQNLLHSAKRSAITRAISQAHTHIPNNSFPFIFPLYNPASIDFVVFWEIPMQRRSGHITLSSITLGATHAALEDILIEAENAKVKRSMYAETQREKMEVLDAVRRSEWNAEMNPVVLTLKETDNIIHDFTQGPCRAPIIMALRNYSSTHTSRYTLRLIAGPESYSSESDLLPPPYTGRLSFRGTLGPSQMCTIQSQLWITHPGIYGLSGWSLETEVLEKPQSTTRQDSHIDIRHRYRQVPSSGDKMCLVVSDIHAL